MFYISELTGIGVILDFYGARWRTIADEVKEMQRLCKYCKWWNRIHPISESGDCSNHIVYDKISMGYDIGDDELLVDEDFGCNFWEKREDEQF